MLRNALISLSLLAGAAGAWADTATPVGLWKTIDDDGKTEKSLARITESGGQLSGRIETLFDKSK